MRRDYARFVEREAEVIAISPESIQAVRDYWRQEDLPFIGLADPDHAVANRYRQEVNLFKMGRMPAVIVVSKDGQVSLQHYANSMADIPPNSRVLAVLDALQSSAG